MGGDMPQGSGSSAPSVADSPATAPAIPWLGGICSVNWIEHACMLKFKFTMHVLKLQFSWGRALWIGSHSRLCHRHNPLFNSLDTICCYLERRSMRLNLPRHILLIRLIYELEGVMHVDVVFFPCMFSLKEKLEPHTADKKCGECGPQIAYIYVVFQACCVCVCVCLGCWLELQAPLESWRSSTKSWSICRLLQWSLLLRGRFVSK